MKRTVKQTVFYGSCCICFCFIVSFYFSFVVTTCKRHTCPVLPLAVRSILHTARDLN